MTIEEYYLIFPDSETQEIEHTLAIDDIVDVNGMVLTTSALSTTNLMYRVHKIRKQEKTGSVITYYYLEQLNIYDVKALRRGY